ncbi:hypothetical protein [Moraxella marmotae]|uniref:hypothetical protein n=1 Tax=Moraxella marmotae TaxID=3344520 RepID=UPI0035F4E08F
MEEPVARINNLSHYNLKTLNKNDLNFFLLMLHKNYNIDEIFKPTKGVFVSVDMDVISYDDVLMPKKLWWVFVKNLAL